MIGALADLVVSQAAVAPSDPLATVAAGGGALGLVMVIANKAVDAALAKWRSGSHEAEREAKETTRRMIESLASASERDRDVQARIAELLRDTARELEEGRREAREAHARIEGQLVDLRRER